jgi:Fuc2NAc and GlcNAc transferase
MLTLLGLVVVLLGAAALTGWIRSYALRHRILDIPNARSSHSVPTPRGGGVSIVLMTLAALCVAGLAGWVPRDVVVALLVGGVLVAGIGWLDDRSHIPARWRMLVHLAAAGWVVAGPGWVAALPMPGGEVALGWIAALLGVLWIAWVLNLYNFMDGIDGIAGIEAVTVSAAAAGLLWHAQEPGLAFVVAALGAASLGFLAWNWPPAKVFMGDAGSAFLGFAFGSLALVTHALGALVIWSWLILLGAFLVDATVTLVRRLLRGERVYEAHRSHAYQHASRRLGSHRTVSVAVGVLNIAWLAPWALLAALRPEWGIMIVAIAWAPLVAVALRFQAGQAELHQA